MRMKFNLKSILIVVFLLFISVFLYEKYIDTSYLGPQAAYVKPSFEYKFVLRDSIYFIEFESNGQLIYTPVGKSKIDLSRYVGKQVPVEIEFPHQREQIPRFLSSQQCIRDVCRYFYPDHREVSVVNVLDLVLSPN